MMTQLQTARAEQPAVRLFRGNLALAPSLAEPADLSRHLEREALRITHLLQTTLEADELIRLFSQALQGCVGHDGIAYRHEALRLTVEQGIQSRHQCSYRLAVGAEELGEVTLYRRRAFNGGETAALDQLVWSLLYPLRNALLYRRALESAFRDPLTGANNRGAFDQTLLREVELAHRHATPLALVVIDIDHFKAINDNFGHAVGDCALQSLVACAEECMRGSDALYRYGGEEFVLLLSNTDAKGATRMAERLRREVAHREHQCGGTALTMTISMGVAELAAGEDGKALFKRADAALYQSKERGRNRVTVA